MPFFVIQLEGIVRAPAYRALFTSLDDEQRTELRALGSLLVDGRPLSMIGTDELEAVRDVWPAACTDIGVERIAFVLPLPLFAALGPVLERTVESFAPLGVAARFSHELELADADVVAAWLEERPPTRALSWRSVAAAAETHARGSGDFAAVIVGLLRDMLRDGEIAELERARGLRELLVLARATKHTSIITEVAPKAVELALEHGDKGLAAEAIGAQGFVAGLEKNWQTSAEFYREASALALSSDLAPHRAGVLRACEGHALMNAGRFAEATAVYRALSSGEVAGRREATDFHNLALCLEKTGHFAEAGAAIRQAVQLRSPPGSPDAMDDWLLYARICCGLKAWTAAEDAAAVAERIAAAAVGPDHAIMREVDQLKATIAEARPRGLRRLWPFAK